MKTLFTKLQTPTIELKLEAVDSSGKKDTLTVGFNRYPIKEASAKLDTFMKIMEEAQANMDTTNLDSSGLDSYFSEEVAYIKSASLVVRDSETGKDTVLEVKDTRNAQKSDFWEDGEGCLVAVLGLYLNSTPWKSAFIDASQKALLNTKVDLEEAKLKN